jgi:hypothetical protein
VVKSHIQELIGIDVSNLATLGDLSSLEKSLKQYADTAVESIPQPDLSDYTTKYELQDLSKYLKNNSIFYKFLSIFMIFQRFFE